MREGAKTGELQPRGRVVAQAPQGQGGGVGKGKVAEGNRKRSATQSGQYAVNEKQQKQGVTLVLSDSMLKDRHGMGFQGVVQNRTTRRVLVNAVGGASAEQAVARGVEDVWKISSWLMREGISEREVEGVVVMVGTNDWDNGIKRGESALMVAEKLKRNLMGIKGLVQQRFGRHVGVGWVSIMGRADVPREAEFARGRINALVGAALELEGWRVRGVEKDYNGPINSIVDRMGLHPNIEGLDVLGWTVVRLVEGK